MQVQLNQMQWKSKSNKIKKSNAEKSMNQLNAVAAIFEHMMV